MNVVLATVTRIMSLGEEVIVFFAPSKHKGIQLNFKITNASPVQKLSYKAFLTAMGLNSDVYTLPDVKKEFEKLNHKQITLIYDGDGRPHATGKEVGYYYLLNAEGIQLLPYANVISKKPA